MDLKFGCLSNVINEEYEAIDGGIHKRYFNKNSDLLVKSLCETFIKGEFKDKKDALKMDLVLFVEYILMGHDYRHKVSLWLLRLVEDTRVYCVGGIVFQDKHSLHKVGFRDLPKGKIIARYNIYDFPWGLQVCIKPFCTYCCLF